MNSIKYTYTSQKGSFRVRIDFKLGVFDWAGPSGYQNAPMRADGCLPRRANAQEVTTMWYIGIDVHKKMCSTCIKDQEGNIQKELEFPNKSTGNMWLRLYLGLEEAGVDVVLANPKKTKAIAEAKLNNLCRYNCSSRNFFGSSSRDEYSNI